MERIILKVLDNLQTLKGPTYFQNAPIFYREHWISISLMKKSFQSQTPQTSSVECQMTVKAFYFLCLCHQKRDISNSRAFQYQPKAKHCKIYTSVRMTVKNINGKRQRDLFSMEINRGDFWLSV